MAHSTSALISLILAVLTFAAMQVLQKYLSASPPATVLGGFAGSNVFLFLLTAVSNFEMEFFAVNFKAGIPEVLFCLLAALFASGLVHRVCVTTCLLFSIGMLYLINKISSTKYLPPEQRGGAAVPVSKKKK